MDEEIRSLVNEALERARATLREHRDQVEAVAARSLATEVIEEEELRRILGPKVAAPAGLLTPHASAERGAAPRDEKPASPSPWRQTHA